MSVHVDSAKQFSRGWRSAKHPFIGLRPVHKVCFICITLLTTVASLAGCQNGIGDRPTNVPVTMSIPFPEKAPPSPWSAGQRSTAMHAGVPTTGSVRGTGTDGQTHSTVAGANVTVSKSNHVTHVNSHGSLTPIAVPQGLQISSTRRVVGITTAAEVGAGGAYTCARMVDGTVECWGSNEQRQLGDGTTTNSPVPIPVFGITTATAISTGGYHSCAHLQDNTLLCWGLNNNGELGNESTPGSAVVQVRGIKGSSVAAGGHHSCAVLEDSTVRCWGYNVLGQLGNGTTDNSSSPVAVTGMTTATMVAAGGGHNCARLANQTVKCWGYNNEGQLGNGTKTNSSVPVPVLGITTATSVSVGERHSCARLEDSTVHCWGLNTVGQLGNGKTGTSLNPVVVTGLTTATTVATGPFHACALLADKTVRCWGDNSKGQLGDGTTTNSSVPVPVLGITTATAISTGGYNSCARLENGTIVCWGDNKSGQLGTIDPLTQDLSWATVPIVKRSGASNPMLARSRVATLKQGLSSTDSLAMRADQIDADSEAMRGTYRLTIPLIDLPGRVEPFRLILKYQARIWPGDEGRSNGVTFPMLDGDLIDAPGWSLGLPKLLGAILIHADGSRMPAILKKFESHGVTEENTYVATDGSNIEYRIQILKDGSSSAMADIRYPDGSVTLMKGVYVEDVRNTRLYPTEFIDRHGNVTTIEYAPPYTPKVAPLPTRISDPMGREIRFYYQPGNRLTAITTIIRGSEDVEKVLARFTYKPILMYKMIGFVPQLDEVETAMCLNGIYFPTTSTGYWFGEPDSYNMYGMIVHVREQVEMKHTGDPNNVSEEGQLNSGRTVRERVYDFPLNADEVYAKQGDRLAFPRYTTLTETADGLPPMVTHYSVSPPNNNMAGPFVVVLPDNSRRETSLNESGLPLSRRIFEPDGKFLSGEEYVWMEGPDGITRLADLYETDVSGMKRRTQCLYSFKGNSIGLLESMTQHDWTPDGAPRPLRITAFKYLEDPEYLQRGIRGLVSRREVYAGLWSKPEERIDYEYDGFELVRDFEDKLENNIFFTRRDLLGWLPQNAVKRHGDLTRIKRWINPQADGVNSTIDTDYQYTWAGLRSQVRVDGKVRMQFAYNVVTGYGLPTTITYGDGHVPQDSYDLSIQWNVSTGLPTSIGDKDGRQQRLTYDAADRLDGAYEDLRGFTRREYQKGGQVHIESTFLGDRLALQRQTEFNGLGLPYRITESIPGSPEVETRFQYDGRGRIARYTRPHLLKDPPQWTTMEYTANGDVKKVILPDETVVTTEYGRDGAPVNLVQYGTVNMETDRWHRSKYIVRDGLSRVVQVLEYSPTNTSWTSTEYTYDARSNLVEIRPPGLLSSSYRFKYDGLSRLTHRALPYRASSLNDLGEAVPSGGQWSDYFKYNADSQLVRHMDPRGVATDYERREDPLGRLFGIHYHIPHSPSSPITPTPDVAIGYDPLHPFKPGTISQSVADDPYSQVAETFGYDKVGELDQIVTRIEMLANQPVRRQISRIDNSLNGRNIEQFSLHVGNSPPLAWTYGYDGSGRQTAVLGIVAGLQWAVTAGFNPIGSLKELFYLQSDYEEKETFEWEATSGRLSRQTLSAMGRVEADYVYSFPKVRFSRAEIFRVEDFVGKNTVDHSYDELGRLSTTGEPVPFPPRNYRWYEYEYDVAGNRMGSHLFESRPIVFDPNAPDRTPSKIDLGAAFADGHPTIAVEVGTYHVTSQGHLYDAAGNVIRLERKDGTVLTLGYDAVGRLTQVERNGSTETYTYAPDGTLMVVKRPDESRLIFLWHDSHTQSTFEVPAGGGEMQHSETTVMLAGRLVARLKGPMDNPTPFFMHHYATGTVTTSPPSLVTRTNTLTYGSETIPPPSASFERRFHSYFRSSFGLDYAVHRFYDPESGRFLQPDPLGQELYNLEDPQSLNPYVFLRSDPVKRRDPVGLDGCQDGSFSSPEDGVKCTLGPPGKAVIDTINRKEYVTTVHDYTDTWVNSLLDGSSPWLGSGFQQEYDNYVEFTKEEQSQYKENKRKSQECSVAKVNIGKAGQNVARVAGKIAKFNAQVKALQAKTVPSAFGIGGAVMTGLRGGWVTAFIFGAVATAMAVGNTYDYYALDIDRANLIVEQNEAKGSLQAAQEAVAAACN